MKKKTHRKSTDIFLTTKDTVLLLVRVLIFKYSYLLNAMSLNHYEPIPPLQTSKQSETDPATLFVLAYSSTDEPGRCV